MRPSSRYMLILSLCFWLSDRLAATTVSPPPTREYVAQTWVGFSTNDAFTLRFDLREDGKGKGSLVYFDEPPQLFDVTSWSLDYDRLKVSVRFHAGNERTAQLEGTFKRYLLSHVEGMLPNPEKFGERWIPGRLELSIATGGGTLRFGVYPERELYERLRRVGSSADRQTRRP